MRVREIMSKHPDYLSPDASLQEVCQEMEKHDYGFIPIGDTKKDRLVGVITDRDISIRAVAKGKSPRETKVKEVMTKKVLYCFEDDDLEKAAELMCKAQVHRLIVLNKDKHICGILSLHDIAEKTHNEKLLGEIKHDITMH